MRRAGQRRGGAARCAQAPGRAGRARAGTRAASPGSAPCAARRLPAVLAPAARMDRETRALAEAHFRGLAGRPPGPAPAPPRVDFIAEPAALPYAAFVRRYLLPNRPCVFSRAFTDGWGGRRRWVTPAGTPDFDYLLRRFGDAVVPVANCAQREYNANPKRHMPLREYVGYWREYIRAGYASARGCLYLKDWHLCRDAPAEDVFTLPVYFSSDWLNEYWDARGQDDYRFVYMGPAGSWSPFHADILRSYSWSANICGRKKWLLFPPGQEEALRDPLGGLPFDVTAPGLQGRCAPPLELTQEAGEVVFVPSGWHHQVHNLEDTISVNHNWVNGCNLASMWRFLQQELRAVQREVAEWRDTMPDWHQHCQVILRSCSGINFEEFYDFLKVIAEKRLRVLMAPELEGASPGLGPQQAAFDVGRIAEVLASLVAHPDFQRVEAAAFLPPPGVLLRRLEEGVAASSVL
ncbi:2-oxoglutarate and iron-dependent oxygenase JMJD4 [Galemys pyrenaicus]|uniref:2-oxoglutarate and iron-dependent oxygenase JMJD4 n=1 Tax=Galemys pyrenaicus TaxID=202257 RepID=A0A8J6DIC7_GALPY|nr:2-oxoglutarate and iron-dependent oxygenase JMJD4 [Galemys pyrenaicus]